MTSALGTIVGSADFDLRYEKSDCNLWGTPVPHVPVPREGSLQSKFLPLQCIEVRKQLCAFLMHEIVEHLQVVRLFARPLNLIFVRKQGAQCRLLSSMESLFELIHFPIINPPHVHTGASQTFPHVC